MAELEYRFVGNHAQDLADGRMLAPGESVVLSEEDVRDPHNEALLADEVLIPVDEKQAAEHEARLAERRVARREKQERKGTGDAPGTPSTAPQPEEDK
jgi:hypothetical protein